jgi:hypothetical protein
MKFVVFSILLLLVLSNEVFSDETSDNKATWRIEEEDDIQDIKISPSSLYSIYFTDSDEGTGVKCIQTVDGKAMWQQEYPRMPFKYTKYCTFLNEDIFYMLENGSHLFIDTKTGKTLKELHFFRNYTGTFTVDTSTVHRVYFNYIADSVQIINTKTQDILFSREIDNVNAGDINIVNQENYRIYYSRNFGIIVLDKVKGEVPIYFDNDKYDINFSIAKPLVAYQNNAILYCDDYIAFYDLTTGKVIHKIDIEYYDNHSSPFILNNKLYFLHRENEKYKIFDVSTGKQVFTNITDNFSKYIRNIYSIDNESILMTTYDHHTKTAGLEKYSTSTGKLMWNRYLFAYNNEFELKPEGRFVQNTYTEVERENTTRFDGTKDRTFKHIIHVLPKWKHDICKHDHNNTDEKWKKNLITEYTLFDHQFEVLDYDKNNIVVCCYGEISKPANTSEDEFDAEGIYILDSKTGEIVASKLEEITIDGYENEIAPNFKKTAEGSILITPHYLFSIDTRKISSEKYEFYAIADENDSDDIIFSVRDEDNEYETYYSVRMNQGKPEYQFLLRVPEDCYDDEIVSNRILNHFSIKLVSLGYSYMFDDEKIHIYSRIKEYITGSDLGKAIDEIDFEDDVFSFEHPKDSKIKYLQGFEIYDSTITLSNENGLYMFSADGSCPAFIEDASMVLSDPGIEYNNCIVSFPNMDALYIVGTKCPRGVKFQIEDDIETDIIYKLDDKHEILFIIEDEMLSRYSIK